MTDIDKLDAALERIKAALPRTSTREIVSCSDIQDLLPELLAVFYAACALEDATARAVDAGPLQCALVTLCQAVRNAKESQ